MGVGLTGLPTGSRYVRHATGLLRPCPLQAERQPLGERRYVLLNALWRGFGEVFTGWNRFGEALER